MSLNYMGVRNGPWNSDGAGNVSSTRILVYHFNAAETSVEVAQQAEIPTPGTAHPDDPKLPLTSVAVSEPMEGDERKSGKYEVTLTYSRSPGDASLNNSNDKTLAPWKRNPYDISFTPVEVVKAFQKAYQAGDTNGSPSKPVLNPAGDPYEDSTAEQNTVLKFSYNLETFNPGWINTYIDTINSGNIVVCDVGITSRHGRIRNLSASKVEEYDNEGVLQYTYWRVDVEIEVAVKEWKREILARGLYFVDSAVKYRIYTDKDGTLGKLSDMGDSPIPVDEPQKLNADGSLWTTGDVYYDTFYDHFASGWRELSFPGSAKL